MSLKSMLIATTLLLLILAASASTTPQQVHVAYAGSGLAISFLTTSELSGAPTVKYGNAPNNMTQVATGETVSYFKSSYIHHVVISSIHYNTKVFYQPEGGDVYNVTTSRAAGDEAPVTVCVVGDMGIKNSEDTMRQVQSTPVVDASDFYLHIGDLSYADDWYLRLGHEGGSYESSWDDWLNAMQPVMSHKAYMVLPGNHEATCTEVTPFLCPEDEKNFTAYRYRFRMPFKESHATNNMWYSFDYGMVHFIQISTETDFPGAPEGAGTYLGGGPFGPQLTWLENDLKQANLNRANTPFIIVSGHRPLYSSGGSCDACRKVFEPLFLKYGVDLYFSGHVHWYERNYAIAESKVVSKDYKNPTAPVYIVNGAAGNVEGHTGERTKQDFTAVINRDDYGYGMLTVFNSTTLSWKFYGASNNALLDEMVLEKMSHIP